jgi:hypothetical protein
MYTIPPIYDGVSAIASMYVVPHSIAWRWHAESDTLDIRTFVPIGFLDTFAD